MKTVLTLAALLVAVTVQAGEVVGRYDADGGLTTSASRDPIPSQTDEGLGAGTSE